MKKLFHNILCTVSRRYRAAHCQHVDELPPRMSRRLRDECRKMDPRTWNSARDMMDDLLRECREEDADGIELLLLRVGSHSEVFR